MEYKCGSCREISVLSPRAKFCPVCGSSSLILVVKEQAEPTQKETVGVYKTATANVEELGPKADFWKLEPGALKPPVEKEEEDRPRRKR
jgi:hypothetical protein